MFIRIVWKIVAPIMITTAVCSRICPYFRHSDNFMPPTPRNLTHSLLATDRAIHFSWESSIIVNFLLEIWKSYIMHSARKCLLVSVNLSWLILNCKNSSETFERDSRLFCWNFRCTSKVKCIMWNRPHSCFFSVQAHGSSPRRVKSFSRVFLQVWRYCFEQLERQIWNQLVGIRVFCLSKVEV